MKKSIYFINLIIQIALIAVIIYVNTVSMKYYGSFKAKLIVYIFVAVHASLMLYLFNKKHPFTMSNYTLIGSILLLIPLLLNLSVKKPTDEMVKELFLNTEYANEEIIEIQHTMEDDYRYLIITTDNNYLNIHIYNNDQLVQNYTYKDLQIDSIERKSFVYVPAKVNNRKAHQMAQITSSNQVYYLYFFIDNSYNIEVTAIPITDDQISNLKAINNYLYQAEFIDVMEIDNQEYPLVSLTYSYYENVQYSNTDLICLNLYKENYETICYPIYLKENKLNEILLLPDSSKLYYEEGKVGVILYTEANEKVLCYVDLDSKSDNIQLKKIK